MLRAREIGEPAGHACVRLIRAYMGVYVCGCTCIVYIYSSSYAIIYLVGYLVTCIRVHEYYSFVSAMITQCYMVNYLNIYISLHSLHIVL